MVCSQYKCTDERDRGAAREYFGSQSRDVTRLVGIIKLASVLKAQHNGEGRTRTLGHSTEEKCVGCTSDGRLGGQAVDKDAGA